MSLKIRLLFNRVKVLSGYKTMNVAVLALFRLILARNAIRGEAIVWQADDVRLICQYIVLDVDGEFFVPSMRWMEDNIQTIFYHRIISSQLMLLSSMTTV